MNELIETRRDCPAFATQQEEDEYWARYHAEIEARTLKAFDSGAVKRGGTAKIVAELREKHADMAPKKR